MNENKDRSRPESCVESMAPAGLLDVRVGVEAILGVLKRAGRSGGNVSSLDGDVEHLDKALAACSIAQLIRLIGIICIRSERVDLAVRQHVELFAITDLGMHPQNVEKLNLPTLRGSLAGLLLPSVNETKTCATCAFRQGTAANQSEPTAADIAFLLADGPGEAFYCHEDAPEGGSTSLCRGFAQAIKQAL
jgi:hypothetical protein